jgi:hypothetical protein
MIIAIMGECINEHKQFLGVKYAGKDTVRDIIRDHTINHKVQYLNFADKLKETLSDIYQPQISDLYQRLNTQELKETPIPELNNTTPRWLAEKFGTELINSSKLLSGIWIKYYISQILRQILSPIERFLVEMIGPSCLTIDTLIHELINLKNGMKHYGFPDLPDQKPDFPTLFITSDLRFPAEYHALNKLKQSNICKVTFIKVIRTIPNQQQPTTPIHPSNQSYPEMTPDIILENNSTIENLTHEIQKLIHT